MKKRPKITLLDWIGGFLAGGFTGLFLTGCLASIFHLDKKYDRKNKSDDHENTTTLQQ
jgi:hypothetical protein